MTTKCYGFGDGRFRYAEQSRTISLREEAMLQSLPKDYDLVAMGKATAFSAFGRLIGNAVPVPPGKFMIEVLLEHVDAHGSFLNRVFGLAVDADGSRPEQ
ncbi:MAG: DNA cytosine methyltransferase [Boseongicola sp.]|nr:DNA cytosine methyltransferase [Boseongicola sp.]